MPNPKLPFFAYGLLVPGQPAFFQIRDDVADCEKACAPGVLLIQDGLPILKKSGTGTTEGDLMTFKDESAREAYEKIRAFEPTSIYRWDTVVVADQRANVLYATHPEAGNPLDWPGWDGWEDPLLTDALDVVEVTQRQALQKQGFQRLFRLQMAYLLLWSAIERYLTFRYAPTDSIEKKVENLSGEKGFAELVEEHVPKAPGHVPNVVDSRYPGRKALQLDASDPSQCLAFYRRVRHNATHRGKSGPGRDTELLDDSLTQLVPIFRGVLETAREEAKSDRSRVRNPQRGLEAATNNTE